MQEDKLQKFANNSLTDREDIEEVVGWIEADDANQKEFNRIKNLWMYTDFKNFNDLTAIKESKRNILKLVALTMLKYAAVFILAFFIGGYVIHFYQDSTDRIGYNEIVVPKGESAEVILADQTHVWLNSGARFKYPVNFTKKTRDVQLTGEAYFEVKKNEKKPFRVQTSDLWVKVIGTSFNVSAFNNSRTIEVTLVEGSVNLETTDGELLSELEPSEQASFNKNKRELKVCKVNTRFYTSWKEGIIFFSDERLGDIAQKLEQWFNVEIIFEEPSLRDIKYSGSILKNKPIDQILEILKYTTDIDYTLEVNDLKPIVIHIKDLPMKKKRNR